MSPELPVNAVDPSGNEFDLSSLQASVNTYISTMAARISTAFATGGVAVGRLWNAIGQRASDTVQAVFEMFPDLEVAPQTPIGGRIIDFTLRYGSRIANLEVKYKIPARAGDALDRLVGQISAMVAQAGQQAVVWTMKEPTIREMELLQRQLGCTAFSQTQFVSGVCGMVRWIGLHFGL